MSTLTERVRGFSAWITRQSVGDQRNVDYFTLIAIIPALVILLVIAVFPIFYAFWLSLHDARLLTLEMSWVGFKNYFELYRNPAFFQSIGRGVVFTVGSIIFQITVGLGLALTLKEKFIGSSLARTLALFPYLVPTLGVALVWKWLLSPSFGVVNYYLVDLGFVERSVPFFGSFELAMPMLIVANSWKFTSFAVVLFLARLQSIDSSLYEQAKISGASPYQMFRDITLPNLRSAILLVILLRSIWQFNKFDIVFLLTKGGPLDATTTLPVYIYNTTFNSYELALGSAAALHLFAILAIVASVYFWYFKPGDEVEAGS